MKNWIAGIVLGLVAGCGMAHAAPDAAVDIDDGGVDASRVRDAGRDAPQPPDALCPDADGDGARAASCGGDDCDDSDPRVGPTATICADATHVRRCVGGLMHASDPCDAATPDCDARTGACAASACGDGVVHPDEDCEPDPHAGGCTRMCELQCSDLTQCPLPDQYCLPDSSGTQGHCVTVADPSAPGGPGDPCASNSDCWTGLCLPDSRLCSVFGVQNSTCARWGGWSSSYSPPYLHAVAYPDPWVCLFPCFSSRDCAPGAVCELVNMDVAASSTPEFVSVSATCRTSSATAPLGADCAGSDSCADGACTREHGCTRVCEADLDCPDGWHCRAYDFGSYPPPTPLGYGWPRICQQ